MSPAESRLVDVVGSVEGGGLRLHAALEGEGPPLLVLHGFTGSTESMEGVAAGLRDPRISSLGHVIARADDADAVDFRPLLQKFDGLLVRRAIDDDDLVGRPSLG